jgi:hypothetical protein
MAEEVRSTEEYSVTGEGVVAKVKELVHEGTIRRLIIRNEEGRTLLEVPLTLGVVGAILAPTWAAIGAIAALVTNCTLVVERDEGTS